MNYSQRREALRQRCHQEGVGALLVTSPPNVLYLSGFTGGDSWLLLLCPAGPAAERPVLLTDFRYREQAESEAPDLEVVTRNHESLTDLVGRLLPKDLRLAFEASHISHAQYRRLAEKVGAERLHPAEGWVEELREVKSPEEVERLRRAVAAAEGAFREVRGWLRPGVTEKEVADELVYRMRRRGAQMESFPVIVAGGERASLPHARSTERPLRPGEAVLVDWGARVDFYNCDLTRVLFLDSIPGSIEVVYRVVLGAQQEALEACRPGRPLGEVDKAARRFIAQAGYGEAFGHALGHGVGLQVHERPTVRGGAEEPLRTGMVHTVEPGIYLPGVGGVRIEDMVLVTEAGAERLTSLPRDLEDMVV